MQSITKTLYSFHKQFNGKFKVKESTVYSNGNVKTRTIKKDLGHYFANELTEKLNKNKQNDFPKNGVRKNKNKG